MGNTSGQPPQDWKVVELNYRGRPFKVYDTGEHASIFTFDDESSVRDRWWGINSADVVYDIGCGFGSYTLPALAWGAVVYAFGPPIHDFGALAHSVNLNGWNGRCAMVPVGCYNMGGWLNADTHEISGVPFDRSFFVAPLDDLNIDTPALTWIKIDVEGAEVAVLTGAAKTIERFKPKILIENHLFIDRTLSAQCEAFLKMYGYHKVDEIPYHNISHSLYTQ